MTKKPKLPLIIAALLFLTIVVGCTNSSDDLPEPDQSIENGTSNSNNDDNDSDEGGGSDSSGSSDYNYPSQRYDTLTVTEFINEEFEGSVCVKGYIIGDCTKSFSYAEFEPPFTQPQSLLMADSKYERDKGNIIAIQLKSGSKIRKHMNLVDNPGWYGKRVVFCGYKERYLGMAGMKDIMSYPSYNP